MNLSYTLPRTFGTFPLVIFINCENINNGTLSGVFKGYVDCFNLPNNVCNMFLLGGDLKSFSCAVWR